MSNKARCVGWLCGWVGAAGVGLALVACGDDSAAAGFIGTGGANALYLITTSGADADRGESYLVTSESFDADSTVAPEDGPSLPGAVDPVVSDGAAYVPAPNNPSIIRYEPDATGRLQTVASLFFEGLALPKITSEQIYIRYFDKGYVFDPKGPRLIVWNPDAMERTGQEIDLSALNRDGLQPVLALEQSGPTRRGNQLLIPVSWRDDDGHPRDASGFLILDTEKDEVLASGEDARCGESHATVHDPDGRVYFFPSASASELHFRAADRPSCVLRIDVDSDAFDDEYKLDLSALVSDAAAAGAVPDGETGFFFTALDETLHSEVAADHGAYWRFWHYDFVSEEAHRVESLPAWAGDRSYVRVDGAAYIPAARETDAGWRTTVYKVAGAEDPGELFSFAANWYGMARLR